MSALSLSDFSSPRFWAAAAFDAMVSGDVALYDASGRLLSVHLDVASGEGERRRCLASVRLS